MSTATSIEWTDATWNPVSGCSKVSPGCANCYAEALAHRFWKDREFTDVRCYEERLDIPLHWRRPRRVFVNSMSDLFHESVPDAFRDRVWAVMMLSPRHTFQILTKRPAQMRAYLRAPDLYDRVLRAASDLRAVRPELTSIGISDPAKHPARWIWLGVSCENQRWFDERVAILRDTPAAVRFLSCEPLLGDIDPYTYTEVGILNALAPFEESPGIDWVIVGGESGPRARPCHLGAIRRLLKACRDAGVPAFVKQLGAKPIGPCTPTCTLGDHSMSFRHSKGGDMEEWPTDLQVREFPR